MSLMCAFCYWTGIPESVSDMQDTPDGKAVTVSGGYAVCEDHAAYSVGGQIIKYMDIRGEQL